MTIIANPVVLGIVVVVIAWVVRKLDWQSDGPRAMWLTMGIALAMALAGGLIDGTIISVLTCTPSAAEPIGVIDCVLQIAQNIIGQAAVVWVAAQIIYQALRRGLAGKPVPGLGTRL